MLVLLNNHINQVRSLVAPSEASKGSFPWLTRRSASALQRQKAVSSYCLLALHGIFYKTFLMSDWCPHLADENQFCLVFSLREFPEIKVMKLPLCAKWQLRDYKHQRVCQRLPCNLRGAHAPRDLSFGIDALKKSQQPTHTEFCNSSNKNTETGSLFTKTMKKN